MSIRALIEDLRELADGLETEQPICRELLEAASELIKIMDDTRFTSMEDGDVKPLRDRLRAAIEAAYSAMNHTGK